MAKRGKVVGFEVPGDVKRPQRIRKYKYLYLIVCEDENTERVYFQGFEGKVPQDTIFLETVGTGLDPFGIVKRAVSERDRLEVLGKRTVDVVWVVFDKDDADLNATRVERFRRAFELAIQEGFKIAHSNEVFELWLLLHLSDVNPEIPLARQEIYARLQNEIIKHEGFENFVYVHGNEAILAVIDAVGDERAALERADQLILHHLGKEPLNSNPVTYVGRLVQDLYDWIRFYSYQG